MLRLIVASHPSSETAGEASAAPAAGSRPARLALAVPALGVTQIIAWGSLYYSIAVLAQPMAHSLGLSLPLVFGAFSASLVASGLVAPWIGRAIDRHGGRPVLACGAVLGALALGMIALAREPVLFFAGWMVAGVAMAATLYDAAFAALSQIAGSRYRQALTALTLFGGFASTVFWPLAWQLEDALGWRLTLAVFAALHLAVSLPLIRFALPAHRPEAPLDAAPQPAAATSATPAGMAFFWLAAAFTLAAFVFSAVGAHGVAALQASGLDADAAILAASLIGPMQVAGRIVEYAFARHLPARRVGLAAFATLFASLLLLWGAEGAPRLAFAFALAYGAANGVMTIVRGAVPAELFGKAAYGAVMGRLARPAFLAKASAPLLVSLMLADGNGYEALPPLLAALMAGGLLAYLAALAVLARHASERARWGERPTNVRASGPTVGAGAASDPAGPSTDGRPTRESTAQPSPKERTP